MARYPIKSPPPGYIILPINGRYYPSRLDPAHYMAYALDKDGNQAGHRHHSWDTLPPVSFSKRADAVRFCEQLESQRHPAG
jgi:hypothetical protein